MKEVFAARLSARLSVTVNWSAVLVPPSAFDAVTVYRAWPVAAVGVPEITPVDASIERPVGSAGWTDHDVTAPPPTVGALGATATLASYVAVGVPYERPVGGSPGGGPPPPPPPPPHAAVEIARATASAKRVASDETEPPKRAGRRFIEDLPKCGRVRDVRAPDGQATGWRYDG